MTELSNISYTKKIQSRYGEICYFANDSGAIRLALESYGEWAENEIRFMTTFLPLGGTVVDVGAYIGTHMLAFASAVGPEGHVISIEAQAKSFELLSENVRANGLQNVRLENAIAGAQVEFRDLVEIDPDSAESFGSTSVVSSGAQIDLAREVRTITVDSLQLARCDLLKIDVEGMEDEVLKGARETLARLRPAIYAECNSLEDGLRTVAMLRQSGYAVFAHAVDAYHADNFSGNRSDIFQGAREVAILGVIGPAVEICRNYALRSCELLLDIETADDLALALMNKPQYPSEILRIGAAGLSGGNAVLDQQVKSRDDVALLAAALAVERAEKERLLQETNALRHDADTLRAELERRQNERVEFQKQIDVIFRSRSWRVTAPIRAVTRIWKRA